MPRQIERVPAGAVFTGFEMVYSIYESGDIARLATVIEAMQLLEDDYLGGLGSRGGGKIAFRNLAVSARACTDYGKTVGWETGAATVAAVLADKDALIAWVRQAIPIA